MLTDHGAVDVGDGARGKTAAQTQSELGPQVRIDEAQVLGLGLGRGPKPERRSFGADIGLGLVRPQGEHGALQLLLVQPVEHVGLVPARISSAVQGGE